MIKKLILSAVVLTVLIAGKETHAAGVAGFARSLSSAPAVHMQIAKGEALAEMDLYFDAVIGG